MLPNPIIADLFDVEFKPSRAAIDHVADIIESQGFRIASIDNFDIKIWLNFGLSEGALDGALVIDRMDRAFEITAKDHGISYVALKTRKFEMIEEFLRLLMEDVGDTVGSVANSVA